MLPVQAPRLANIERVGFAVLGADIKALDHANAVAGANGLNVTLDAQLVADIKAIAPAVKALCPLPRRSKWHKATERNPAASAERADTQSAPANK